MLWNLSMEDFSAFWKEHYNPCRWNGGMPELSKNEKEIWASYNNYARFDEDEVAGFAKSHPHLMIRVSVSGETEPCDTVYLYQGCLSEELNEIRYIPNSQVIDWPEDYSPYSAELKDEKFLHFFGDHVSMALDDMLQNTSFVKLAKLILASVGFHEGNEHRMFSAIVGWNIEELVKRAKESQKEWEENE